MNPKIELVQHPSYRTINLSGILGGHRPMYFEAIVYSDEIKADEALSDKDVATERVGIKRTLECRLLVDPFQAKILSQWLNEHIAQYEKTYGKIPSPEEVNDKLNPDKLK